MDLHTSMDAAAIGTGSRQPVSSHPRRPPAHKSVSLRHTPPRDWSNVYEHSRAPSSGLCPSSQSAPRSDQANPPSSVSPRLRTYKQSSGESSDAGKWFENSNNNVTHHPSFVDNEPPFFLHNSSSSETPPDQFDHHINPTHMHSTTMPYRTVPAQLGGEGSGSDDYRSVIDDLTVANKRLKQKLRKYEKLYDAHLQDDKLFEVRFHGLPNDKKKELEETLRKFALGLNDNQPSEPHPSRTSINKNPSSSLTSTRFAESGYASMSASGHNSVSALRGTTFATSKTTPKSPALRQHQNVHSYLHDMPAGLTVKPAAMTEKAKKKLVVRRLEQIFAGKLPLSGDHAQPLQQQEVAQSAARADREAREASGLRMGQEGLREARIMVQDEQLETHDGASSDGPASLKAHGSSSYGSPTQRPTRPLDLDPYRAQVPSDNMDYIRHLGFTPPDLVSGEAPQDGHGWIYLNLLINMAQLHTINVTPDFVKAAVADYSDKFEMSHDGRKIRWRGGHEITRNSSDSSSEQLSSASPNGIDEVRRKEKRRAELGHASSGSSTDPSYYARRIARQEKEREKNKFAYTPLFFHSQESEADGDVPFDDDSSEYSPLPANQTANSSGLDSFPLNSPPRKRRDAGPIIFYNNARFCTDLSGDWRGVTATNPKSYASITSRPIGAPGTTQMAAQHQQELAESKGPLADTSLQLADQMDLDDSTSSESGIIFPSETSEYGDAPPINVERIQFEASGLAGVQAVDNFAIDVQLSKQRIDRPHRVKPIRRVVSKLKPYPHKILDVLKQDVIPSSKRCGEFTRSIIAEKIISTSHERLPNSSLPPPSMLPLDSSSGDAHSDAESDVSSAASDMSSQMNVEPRTAPQLLNISPPHDDSEDAWDAEDDAESDSVDLLATARAIDPTAIHAREREYDSNMADRLAEDIPAGSSAATGAGGSGFNSPESMAIAIDTENVQIPHNGGSGGLLLSKNLKRARTSDNIASLNPGKAPKID